MNPRSKGEQEKADRFGSKYEMLEKPYFPIAVLGAGTMGHRIALVLALACHPVRLMDIESAVLDRAMESMNSELAQMADHELITAEQARAALDRMETNTDLTRAVDEARLVVETVPECLELKQQLFNELDRLCSPETVLTSNSSAIPISDIVRELRWPERAAGWHWFAPPHLVPLIEVVQGGHTAETVIDWLRRFTLQIGQTPIVVRRDLPGFVANRLQHALLREVFYLLDSGVASAEDLDRAVRYSFGIRLIASGPLEQRDLAGLDVHHAAASRIYPTLSNAVTPDRSLAELATHGNLGIKSGRGFFDWKDENAIDVMRERNERLIAAVKLLREVDRYRESTEFHVDETVEKEC